MKKTKVQGILRKVFKIVLKISVGFLALFLLLALLLNIPAFQTYLTGRVSRVISDRIGAEFSVASVKIVIPETFEIKGVFVADLQDDTLLYLNSLRLNLSMFRLLKQELHVDYLGIDSLKTRVYRGAPGSDYNFGFIVNAFSGDTLVKEEPLDKTPSPWKLSVDEISLAGIDMHYRDESIGMEAFLDLGSLEMGVDELDFESPGFFIKDISLKNTSGKLVQWTVEGDQNLSDGNYDRGDSTLSPPLIPSASLDLFELENVKFVYTDLSSGLDLDVDVGAVKLEPGLSELKKKKVKLKDLSLSRSSVRIAMASDTLTADPLTDSLQNDFPDTFTILPGWDIHLDQLNVSDVFFSMDDNSVLPAESGIDYNHLSVEDIGIVAGNIQLSDPFMGVDISHLSLREKSGFVIEKLSMQVGLSPKSASVKNMVFETDKSRIKGDVQADFDVFGDLINQPGKVALAIDLPKSIVNTSDFYSIAGLNPADSLLGNFANLDLDLDLQVEGKLDSLQLKKLDLALYDQTRIIANGEFAALTHPEDLSFDFSIDSLFTGKLDINRMGDTSLLEGIRLPDSVFVSLLAKGTVDSLKTELSFLSSFGNFSAKAFYKSGNEQIRDTFHIHIEPENLHAGKVLQNEAWGEITGKTIASGSGLSTDSISAQLDGGILKAYFNDYAYSQIDLEAKVRGQHYWVILDSKDPNANFDFEATAQFDSSAVELTSQLDLKLLNLYDLNFLDEKIGLTTQCSVQGKYASLNDLEGDFKIDNTNIIYENDFVPLGPITLHPRFTPDETLIDLRSEIINFNFVSNISLQEFEGVMIAAAKQYLGLQDTLVLPSGKKIDFLASIYLSQEFRSQFLPDLKELALDSIRGKYRSENNELSVSLHAPRISYGKINVDSLDVEMNGLNDSLLLHAGFRNLFYDTLFMGALNIKQAIRNGDLKSTISLGENTSRPDYYFDTDVVVSHNAYKFRFTKNGLIMNGQQWEVMPENLLEITDSAVLAKDFIFRKDKQEISFQSGLQEHKIHVASFELSNILNIIKHQNQGKLIRGELMADISLPAHNKYEGVSAELNISNLYVLDSLIGDVNFQVNETETDIDVLFSLDGESNNFNASGKLGKTKYPQPIDFDIVLDIKAPQKLDRLTLGEISSKSGKISGKLKVEGVLDDPQIKGFINFKESQMRINRLNFLAKMNDETIHFNDGGISLDEFTVYDTKGHKLVLGGDVLTKDYRDFSFDLKLKTKNFQPVNSTKADNHVFYGDLIVDADVSLKGDTDLPVIDADITIQEGTQLTYVMPGSEIEIVGSEGVVHFEDSSQGIDTIFKKAQTDYITDSLLLKYEGLDVSASLQLSPKAKFTLIIDPFSGDYASVSGSAHLNYSMDPGGGQSLTGVFEVSDGIYQLSFYGLVKKTFEFEPGSSIAWSGRLMDANMNFTAKNIVRTQSIALVANESAGMTEAEKNIFRQRLPYEVLLNAKGFLSEPKVDFNIALPEKYLVTNPQISSKLTQLNSTQNVSDLNKQVFALLVTGSFIAESPMASTGSTSDNFASTAARNSVNGILADQLNKISNRFIKGVDLNFGLTSYEEYEGSSSELRTELDVQISKRILKDRLTIEAVGSFDLDGSKQYTSTSTSHTYGEFSATYDLNQSREYKLRAYRENAYDLFDGEVAYSGVAFIIEKSFNSLFNRTRDEDKKEEDN